MKTLYPLVLCLTTLVLSSCQKEEYRPARETGRLQISVGLSLTVNEVPLSLKSMLQTDDFRIGIYKEDGTQVMSFETVSVMPDTIELGPRSI